MTDSEQRDAATKFYNSWRGRGDEKSDCQSFWIELCEKVLGVSDVTEKLVFEKRVRVEGQTKFIDIYIPETNVLIEQKGIDKALDKQYPQSGGGEALPRPLSRRGDIPGICLIRMPDNRGACMP